MLMDARSAQGGIHTSVKTTGMQKSRTTNLLKFGKKRGKNASLIDVPWGSVVHTLYI
jgi:hypothetical protein